VVRASCVYWRKANAIHSWFVRNTQGGVDECQYSEVTWEQLLSLMEACDDALSAYAAEDHDKAGKLLHPQEGFFFGDTEMGEYWRRYVSFTADALTEVLHNAKLYGSYTGPVTFGYQASW
jgi:hypothetical protein